MPRPAPTSVWCARGNQDCCVRTVDANKSDFLDNHCGAWCFDKLNRRRGINPVRRRKRTSAPGSVNKSHRPARAMGGVLTGRPYCEHHCIRLIAGGSWNNGSGAGVSAANSNNDLGNANANIGARSVIISRNNDGCGHAARRNIEYERQGRYLRGRSCNKMKG